MERRVYPNLEEGELVIQVGDMGIGFSNIPVYPDHVKWIRGNHDDPQAAREHPNYLGDYGYDEKHEMFWLAGAWSIDWQWRKIWNQKEYEKWVRFKQNSSKPVKKCWWPDEELSQEELDKALDLYIEKKPRIMISHEAPSNITPHVLIRKGLTFKEGDPMFNPEFERMRDYSDFNRPEKLQCIETRTSKTLQRMLNHHTPRFWCFGHFHISKTIDTGSTLFKCCAELEPFHIPE